MQIVHVRTEDEAADVRVLVGEFIDWLYLTYPEGAEKIDAYFQAQGLAEQLRDLLKIFCPPRGDCLLARLDGTAVGVVMVKPRSDGTCEMNRMFVRDSARGRGVGHALVAELLETARGLGYRQMMLAAGPRHTEALRLYETFGFVVDTTLPDTGGGDIEVRMIRDL